jgi:hypothetical protein
MAPLKGAVAAPSLTQRGRRPATQPGTILPERPSIMRTCVRHWVGRPVGTSGAAVGGRDTGDRELDRRPRAGPHLQPTGANRRPHRVADDVRSFSRQKRSAGPAATCTCGCLIGGTTHRRVAGRRGRQTARMILVGMDGDRLQRAHARHVPVSTGPGPLGPIGLLCGVCGVFYPCPALMREMARAKWPDHLFGQHVLNRTGV